MHLITEHPNCMNLRSALFAGVHRIVKAGDAEGNDTEDEEHKHHSHWATVTLNNGHARVAAFGTLDCIRFPFRRSDRVLVHSSRSLHLISLFDVVDPRLLLLPWLLLVLHRLALHRLALHWLALHRYAIHGLLSHRSLSVSNRLRHWHLLHVLLSVHIILLLNNYRN